MAELDLTNDTDSGKAERLCAWCGADITHRRADAKWCKPACREKSRCLDRYPDRGHVSCSVCGTIIKQPKKGRPKLFCGVPCKEAHRSQTAARVAWRESADGTQSVKQAKLRYRETGHGAAVEKAYTKLRIADGRARETKRRWEAKAAISAILLPVQEHPEV